MEAAVGVGVLEHPISILVDFTALFLPLLTIHGKVISVDEVVSCIVGWIDVDHFHLAQVTFLQEF